MLISPSLFHCLALKTQAGKIVFPPSMGSFGVCQVTFGQGPGGRPWEHPAVLRGVLSIQPSEYPPHLGPQIYTAQFLCIQVHDFI